MYKCECGKEYTKDQIKNYRGHIGHCRVVKGEKWYQNYLLTYKKQSENYKEKREKKEKQQIQDWLSTNPKCEHCCKSMIEYYGSGRFCSSLCARSFSTKDKRQEINEKVSLILSARMNTKEGIEHRNREAKKHLKSLNYKFNENPFECSICNKITTSFEGLRTHYRNQHTELKEKRELQRKAKKDKKIIQIGTHSLDITHKELDEYRKNINKCEICKKEVCNGEITNIPHNETKLQVGSKEYKEKMSAILKQTHSKKLSVDHCHKTHTFRGLLCVKCNTFLGWMENYKEQAEYYLSTTPKNRKR